jgi:hypothetical protein
MRCVLLSAAAVMGMIPSGTGVYAAFFPRQGRILPVGFWVLWLLVSLWATFYAPTVVDRLTPLHRGTPHTRHLGRPADRAAGEHG